MDAKSIIKTFPCKHHKNEEILRVCTEQGCENPLCCIECILSNHTLDHKDKVYSIKDFVEEAAKHYTTLRRIKSNEDAPPVEFTNFLDQEEINLANLKIHIDKQKLVVENSVDEILSDFTNLCHKTKKEVCASLDNQVTDLKLNYQYYKSKLHSFYSKSDEDMANPGKEEILTKLNRAADYTSYELAIKNITDDLVSSRTLGGSMEEKMKQMKESIQEMGNLLKLQGKSAPTLAMTEGGVQELMSEIKDVVVPCFKEGFTIQESIFEFSLGNTGTMDSKIISNYSDVNMIRKWISDGTVKFKLLYRGTRDGFSSDAFQKKVKSIKPTLTLIKSADFNKIFGGYVEDQDWTNTSNYKNTTKSFLYSVTSRKKYPQKPNHAQHAIYTNNFLPTFGGGHDIYCAVNGDQNTSSYSNFPYSYEAGSDTKETFAGAYNFKLKEIEVFQVEHSGVFKTSEKPKKEVKKQTSKKKADVSYGDDDDGGMGLFGEE
jgi:hypothetical protein